MFSDEFWIKLPIIIIVLVSFFILERLTGWITLFLKHLGKYVLFMKEAFRKPVRGSIFFRQFIIETYKLGVGSLPICIILSLFTGAVITIQTSYNLVNPFIPRYLIGLATRDSTILEFAPTVISLIMAGKIGSNIASEIGTMRVTEQIDALEVMGLNSASFLVAPKIIAMMFFFPFIILISMGFSIFGGWFFGTTVGAVTTADFVTGVQYLFNPFYVTYAMIKTVVFAFLITSISSYFGYYTKGGALEVGESSTKAVVYSIIFVIIINYLLTQILLT